jgi:hypothetical protein
MSAAGARQPHIWRSSTGDLNLAVILRPKLDIVPFSFAKGFCIVGRCCAHENMRVKYIPVSIPPLYLDL